MDYDYADRCSLLLKLCGMHCKSYDGNVNRYYVACLLELTKNLHRVYVLQSVAEPELSPMGFKI